MSNAEISGEKRVTTEAGALYGLAGERACEERGKKR